MTILTRYALATSIVLLLAMFIFAAVATRSVEELCKAEAYKDAEILCETIINTTRHRMQENDLASVFVMIDDVGRQEGIETIRLFDKDGKIIFSTAKEEIGSAVPITSEVCAACHHSATREAENASRNRGRLVATPAGDESLGFSKGIYNSPECFTAACHAHPENDLLLGIIDVVISLRQINVQGTNFRYNFLILSSIMLFCLFFLLVLITHTYIKEPIKALIRHTRRVSRGELDTPLEPLPKGELRGLGESFQEMTESLRRAQAELHLWGMTLEERVEQRTEEIHRIQAQLIHSERLASIGELAAGFAHEINNPLTGITLFSAMLLENPKLDPALRDDLLTIQGEARRCAEIVNRLLAFSRESHARMEEGAVRDIMEGALALLEHQALFHNIRIVKDYAPEIVPTQLDHDQILQVFINILLNAAQAMPQGGELRIGIGNTPSPPGVEVTIGDNGCGISEEHLTRIFDPFFSTKGANGTGLGLSVSFGIVQNHGGTITVRSTVDVGTVFSIKLPAHRPAPEPPPE